MADEQTDYQQALELFEQGVQCFRDEQLEELFSIWNKAFQQAPEVFSREREVVRSYRELMQEFEKKETSPKKEEKILSGD